MIRGIVELPHYVRDKMRTRKADEIQELCERLKNLEPEKPIVYSLNEFRLKFTGRRNYKFYLIGKFREAGIKKPRLIFDNNKVIIFKND